jgi:acyl CoA:acetate/3-ketoacid CoA transferase beta subunit
MMHVNKAGQSKILKSVVYHWLVGLCQKVVTELAVLEVTPRFKLTRTCSKWR